MSWACRMPAPGYEVSEQPRVQALFESDAFRVSARIREADSGAADCEMQSEKLKTKVSFELMFD